MGELGRGSNGVVFLAAREGLPQCALKVLKEDLSQDEEALRRFRLEAAVSFKLTHPGVIRVLDAGMVGSHPYMAMEYCAGETLAQRLVRGPLPPDEARGLLMELGSAVAHAHLQGVIHRDLKPSNVILEEATRRPRLTDFGLTRDRSLARSLTKSGDVLGTPAYMSPEQFRGQKDVDERVDVWGLGAILYECLTGRRPFPATNVTELAIQVLEEPLPAPSQFATIPPALEVVCKKALAKDREERYPSAVELVRALEVAGEAVLGASRSSRRMAVVRRPDPAASPGGRRPSPALLVAGALLLVGVIAAGAIAVTVLPAREARSAMARVRAMLEGASPPAEALAALDQAEARARELGLMDLLGEGEQLRQAGQLLARAEGLLTAESEDPAVLTELVTKLRERSGERSSRTASLLEARLTFSRIEAAMDGDQPLSSLEALLASVPAAATNEARFTTRLDRLKARLEAHRLLDTTRRATREVGLSRKSGLSTFQRALDDPVATPVRDLLLLERARWYLRHGMLEEARQEGRELAGRPGRAGGEGLLLSGVALLWQGWFVESAVAIDGAAKAHPNEIPGLKARARMSLQADKARQGEQLARQALERDPADVEAMVVAAQCAALSGDVSRAVTELEAVTGEHPEDTGAWIGLMLVRDLAGDEQGSQAAAQRAIGLVAPDSGGFVWLLRGLMRVMRAFTTDRRAFPGGLEDFGRCERLDPKDLRPRLYRAVISGMAERDMAAVGALMELYDEDPQLTQRFIDNLPFPDAQRIFRMLLQGRRR